MTIKEGDSIPSVNLKIMSEKGVSDISTDELFSNKKVVLFSVPGAFTPTCSAQHLPGFIDHADKIKEKNVDTIACMSVNDAFVMDAWGKDRGAGQNVLMVADGNGDFTKALGLELDAKGFGLGMRSQRFSMIVDNGLVTKLNVEEGGGFEVSKAEVILDQLS
ncbi:MAG: peroxiredoxin [Rhodospirillaceae bacterium]|nr:peroxiredoxin [Rhodospirillaceae bacterium]|tara:strand:+ start:319 stop:804 length:486 start_codon:yes stop_codon:yes gene_type:complete